MKAWVNGQESMLINLTDRGLHYGDGVFETMLVTMGKIAMWPQHLARLQEGCRRLNINLGLEDILRQRDMILNKVTTGVLKLMVTRGISGRGYKISGDESPSLIWTHYELPDYPAAFFLEGVDTHVCRTMVSRNPALAGIKHLNRLENVLARQEWQTEYQEGLMCDEFGNIIEGTMSNFFAFKNNILVTPDLTAAGVSGIMRQHILDIARQKGITTEIRDIPIAELDTIDGAMLTNCLIGAWPVRSIDHRRYPIQPFCQSLQAHVATGRQ